MTQLEAMRAGGKINTAAINYGFNLAKPGKNLLELDREIGQFIRNSGGIPSFLNYKGFPGNACLSVNQYVVHSIPRDYELQYGDVLTIDCGVYYESYHTDAAITKCITSLGNIDNKLTEASRKLTLHTIEFLKVGMNSFELACETKRYADFLGLKIFGEFGGHFTGPELHHKAIILHTTDVSSFHQNFMKTIVFAEGDFLCIEPIVTFGNTDFDEMPDNWSIISRDGSISSHFEHTIAIHKDHNEILS